MKKSNKFSPEVRERSVRMVQEHGGEYPSLWVTKCGSSGLRRFVPVSCKCGVSRNSRNPRQRAPGNFMLFLLRQARNEGLERR